MAAAAGAAAVTAVTAVALPSGASDGGSVVERIAFVSDRDGDHDIYLVDRDNTAAGAEQITTDGQPKSYLALSPDGTKIAYVKDRAVWVQAVTGGVPERLTKDSRPETTPVWSPDGGTLLFARQYGVRRSDWDLVFKPLAGPEVRIASPGNDYEPDWSATGSHPIVFTSNRTGTDQLWLANAAGADERQLTFHKHPSNEAAWSPDGSRLAFLRWVEGTGMALMRLDLATGAVTRLGEGGQDWGPSWSPDGTEIAYRHEERKSQRIYIVSAGGGTPQLMGGQVGNSGSPEWGVVAVARPPSTTTSSTQPCLLAPLC